VAIQSYLSEKERSYEKRSTNINDLLNRAKFEKKKEKRATYIVTAGAVLVILIFGAFILL